MPQPSDVLAGLRASTATLLDHLDGLAWDAPEVAAASLCAGWTRGHVLTHLARNADAIARTVSAALRGEVAEMYAHGPEGRNADIEAGSGRAFADQRADVRESAGRLDDVLAAMDAAGGWDRSAAKGRTAGDWLLARWKEVEIHHLDLDAGFGADRWPALFVETVLAEVIDSLGHRSERALRVAITGAGSTVPALRGREWSVGTGAPVAVEGPDWAVLAWLVGRPTAADGVLSAAPELEHYN